MLRDALQTTRRFCSMAGDAHGVVVTDVFSCDVTRAELLTRLGFRQYRLFDPIRVRDLADPLSHQRLPPGFIARSARADDYQQLAAVRNSAFRDDWSGDGFRDEVMRKPGYRPEREIIVVGPDGHIVAFTVTWIDTLNRVGHFEPVGTHRDFQRRGLAQAMMLVALRKLQSLGMHSPTVEHAADNRPALELYSRLGFEKNYELYGYRFDAGGGSGEVSGDGIEPLLEHG